MPSGTWRGDGCVPDGKCCAKSIWHSTFEATHDSAAAYVAEVSGVPSNVRAWVLTSRSLDGIQTPSVVTGFIALELVEMVERGHPVFFHHFHRFPPFPAFPPFPDPGTWDGFPNPSCHREVSGLPTIATGCRTPPHNATPCRGRHPAPHDPGGRRHRQHRRASTASTPCSMITAPDGGARQLGDEYSPAVEPGRLDH